MIRITSLNNDRVRRVQALQRSTRRRVRDGLMVVEGLRLVQELLHSRLPFEEAFFTSSFAETAAGAGVAAALQDAGPCYWVEDDVLQAMADTETPQGVLVVLPLPQVVPDESREGVSLVLDGLREPGNLGTILRTAWAAGVKAVYLLPGTVDHTNPKVVRSAMGAHFYLPIQRASWEALDSLCTGARVWLAEAGGGVHYREAHWTGKVVLILGGEAEGASEAVRSLAQVGPVYIPMANNVDSLNVAVAAGILLFEAAHQRTVEESQACA